MKPLNIARQDRPLKIHFPARLRFGYSACERHLSGLVWVNDPAKVTCRLCLADIEKRSRRPPVPSP